MSTLSNKIFHNANHYLSSPFGSRGVISTSAGKTSSFHSGCDYATNGVKLKQYAIAKGSVLSCGIDTAYGGAKYVWVSYPSLGVKMLHYHLDSISVRSGQAVDSNTVLGTTGQTGRATGIHLHLGVKKLSGGDYIDPEKWSRDNLDSKLKYAPGNYKVKTNLIYVRSGPGKAYTKKSFEKLTLSAQQKIVKLNKGEKSDGYVKGLTFTASQVEYNSKDKLYWGKTPSGWVCLDKCEKI